MFSVYNVIPPYKKYFDGDPATVCLYPFISLLSIVPQTDPVSNYSYFLGYVKHTHTYKKTHTQQKAHTSMCVSSHTQIKAKPGGC